MNSGVLQDGIKSVLDDIDLASVAGKVSLNHHKGFSFRIGGVSISHFQSAGSFQNGLLERNDVILIEPKQLDLANVDLANLESILEEYSFVQK